MQTMTALSPSHLEHILVELRGCSAEKLHDAKLLDALIDRSIASMGLTEVARVSHAFSPHGFTSVRLLSESHFSLHTWPEHGFIALDLCSCKAVSQAWISIFADALETREISVREIDRTRPVR